MTVLNMLLGALIGAFVTVIGFDFGSSAGSKAKDGALIVAAPGVPAEPPRQETPANS